MSGKRRRATPSRNIAFDVLKDVRTGAFAEDALSERLNATKNLKPEDRALATELVYGVLRWRNRLDSIIESCSNHPMERTQAPLLDILRLALYQMFFLERIPAYAAIDQAVTQANDRLGKKPGAFVNAVLRRALRDGATSAEAPQDYPHDPAIYYSHPEWLTKRWIRDHGVERTREILDFNNSRPPLTIRVNTLRIEPSALSETLSGSGIEIAPVPKMPEAFAIMAPAGAVSQLPGFGDGLFVVQDAASQMIAQLLRVEPGDFCKKRLEPQPNSRRLAGRRPDAASGQRSYPAAGDPRLRLALVLSRANVLHIAVKSAGYFKTKTTSSREDKRFNVISKKEPSRSLSSRNP
jgi:16S rRNA (cytosine967-C5)-methyltransferase